MYTYYLLYLLYWFYVWLSRYQRIETVLFEWATAGKASGHQGGQTQYSWRNHLFSPSVFILSPEVCEQGLETSFLGVLWQRGLKWQAEVWFRGYPSTSKILQFLKGPCLGCFMVWRYWQLSRKNKTTNDLEEKFTFQGWTCKILRGTT